MDAIALFTDRMPPAGSVGIPVPIIIAGLMASVIFPVKEVRGAVDEGTGKDPEGGSADSGSGCE